MTPTELKQAQTSLGLTNVEMAELLGLGKTAYHYRRTGEWPVRPAEAALIRLMVKQKESEDAPQ